MKPNENISLFLPAGQVLTITAPSGSTGSVVRLPQMPGGGDSQSTTVINEADITFGPYAGTERFKVFCTAGLVTPTMAVPAPSLMATDAEVAAAVAVIKLAEKTPVNAVAGAGTLTVTGGGSQIADTDTVTIDTKVYTFKTDLTPTEGEVLRGVSDTAALLNLLNAINHTGTPDTDYKCAAVHPTVTGTSSGALTFVGTAKTKGVVGNAIATDSSGAEISWGDTDLVGGIDGTGGVANETCADGSYIYHTPVANGISGNSWRQIALGDLY